MEKIEIQRSIEMASELPDELLKLDTFPNFEF